MQKYPNVIGGSSSDLNVSLIVKEKQEEEHFGFIIFERPEGLNFEAGNWMDIRFPSIDLSIGKTYSFASSPTEPDVMIAFKKGVSKFKKALEQVQSGDIMFITQYGSNGFLLNKNYSSVFIAGGIGVTPFRSMIKQAIDTNSKVTMTLVYLNHNEDFPFKHELDVWQEQYPYLKIHYIVTGKEGRLTKERIKELVPDITERMSYIAGSPAMVTNIEDMLVKLGVNNKDYKIDSFDGY